MTNSLTTVWLSDYDFGVSICDLDMKILHLENALNHSLNEKSHQLDAHLGGNLAFNDAVYSTAFGKGGLGNKLYGNKSNVGNLSAYVVQNYQNTFVTPERVVIAATGV